MPYIEPTEEHGAALLRRDIRGPVEMLNLLRFRDVADYSRSPGLAPDEPVSGAEAYAEYSRHTIPHLEAVGGEVVWMGSGGAPMIGPLDERWDLALLVRYPTVQAFLGMAANPDYLATVGHRTAALEDSRLVPFVPVDRIPDAP